MIGNEHLLIAAVLLFFLQICLLILISREIVEKTGGFFIELDENIGEAFKMIRENVSLEGIEPPNPFQMMMMELIRGHFDNKPIDAKITPLDREQEGRFISK